MKALLFAAALSVSGIAIAQDTTSQNSGTAAAQDTAQPSGQTVDDPSQATGPQGVTQQGTVPNGQANPPAGYNQGVTTGTTGSSGSMGSSGTGMSGGMGGTASTANYPPCSRTVTDSCVQTYERGVRRSTTRRRR